MARLSIRFFALVLLLAGAGCSGQATPALTHPTFPAPTVLPSPTVVLSPVAGTVAEGARLWKDKQCIACHGPTATGGMGGALAGTALPFDQYLAKIRNAIPPKPAMSKDDLSDADAYSIYLWLHAFGNPSANASSAVTPAALPTGQILEFKSGWTRAAINAMAHSRKGVREPPLWLANRIRSSANVP